MIRVKGWASGILLLRLHNTIRSESSFAPQRQCCDAHMLDQGHAYVAPSSRLMQKTNMRYSEPPILHQ